MTNTTVVLSWNETVTSKFSGGVHSSWTQKFGYLLQWTWECRYLFKRVALLSPALYPESKIIQSYGSSILVFWETFIVLVPIYIPINGAQVFPFIHILAKFKVSRYNKRERNHREKHEKSGTSRHSFPLGSASSS